MPRCRDVNAAPLFEQDCDKFLHPLGVSGTIKCSNRTLIISVCRSQYRCIYDLCVLKSLKSRCHCDRPNRLLVFRHFHSKCPSTSYEQYSSCRIPTPTPSKWSFVLRAQVMSAIVIVGVLLVFTTVCLNHTDDQHTMVIRGSSDKTV